MWFDESISVQLAHKAPSEIIHTAMYEDPNPPLYGILIHYWVNVFGDSEEGVRSLSILASALAGGILFLLCLNFFNWQTSVFASLMYFTSNELYYYALEARTYGLIVLFVLCSYYLFLSIIKRPTIVKALLFAIANACIFYSHFLACLVLIGEILLFPLFAFTAGRVSCENENLNISISAKTKVITYLFISALIFTFFLWPWKDRTVFLLFEGGKAMWLAKPTAVDFKNCVYDFFNNKSLYHAHLYTAIVFVLLLIVKRFREDTFSWRMALFAIIVGPGLMYLNYFAAGFTPIFLKRYILYSFLGFILLYSYLLSVLKFPFLIKISLFFILSVFSFLKITYPREAIYEYNKAVPFLKNLQKNNNTLIVNDLQYLFAYYYDKSLLGLKTFDETYNAMISKGVFEFKPDNLTWPVDQDFSNYKDIYYSRTFAGYYDPEDKISTMLKQKYVCVKEISDFKGIQITHYTNPNYKTTSK